MAEGGTATEVKAPAPTPEAPKPAPQPEQSGVGHQAEQKVATMLQEPNANINAILHQVADGKAFAGMDMADQILKQATGPSTEVATVGNTDVVAEAEAITKEAAVVQAAEDIAKQSAPQTETPTASTELVLAEKPIQQEQPTDTQTQQTETTQPETDVSRGQQLVDMMGVSADASPQEIEEAAKKVFEGKDFAEILGVDANASDQEIKAATRKLFKDLHTDTNSDARAEEALKLFNAARTKHEKQRKIEGEPIQTTETTEAPPVSEQGQTSWTRVVMQPPMREVLTEAEEEVEQPAEKDQVQEFIEQKVKDLVTPEDAKEISQDLADEVKAHPDLKEPVEEILEKVATDQNPIQDLEQQAQEIQTQIATTTETQTLPTKEIGALKIVLEIIQKLIKALITAAGRTKIPVFTRTATTHTGQTAPAPEVVRPAQPAIESAPHSTSSRPTATPDYQVTLERTDQQPATVVQPLAIETKQPELTAAPPQKAIDQAPQRPALEAAPKAPAALPAAKE